MTIIKISNMWTRPDGGHF